MTFCTKCGHKNEQEARFCEECGNPLKGTAAVLPAAVPHRAVPYAAQVQATGLTKTVVAVQTKKIALFVGIGVVLIAIAAGVAAYFLSDESPSNALFANLVEKSLLANPALYKSKYCLDNFAYEKDPVFVSGNDGGTKGWMGVLTIGGLYSEPEVIINANGFFNSEQLKYRKTEAGKKATQGGKLCYADGVTVKSVNDFTLGRKIGDAQVSRADVTFLLKNPMPWVSQPQTKQAGKDIQTEFQDAKVFVLKDRKWSLATAAQIQSAESTMDVRTQSKSASNNQGLLSWIKNFFGARENPLVGRWKSSLLGFTVVSFEFGVDTMTTNSGKIKVRYEVTDKDVTVYPLQDGEVGFVFNIIDGNTMSVNMGVAEIRIQRDN